nr:hypothetical protein [Bacteroidales bacterium]
MDSKKKAAPISNGNHKRQLQDNDNFVMLNPQFEDLNKPDTFINHIEALTKNKITPHDEILNKLKSQINRVDFKALANPQNIENFKINNKHYLVITIEKLIEIANSNHWGLCKNHDFIYIYNSAYWSDIDKETFQKFLGEVSE